MNTLLKNLGTPSLVSGLVLAGALASVACSDPPFTTVEPRRPGGARNAGGAEGGGGDPGSGGVGNGSGGQPGGSANAADSGIDAEPDAGAGGSDGGGTDAGSGGAGGDSGTAPVEACKVDADCAPSNPDARHCTMACVRTDGRASCQVQPRDADGDGHLDAACVTGNGDDCDDTNKNVYTGAPELCDGLDNDCNNRADLDDGMPLGGKTKRVFELAGTASLGIAPSPQGFAVLSIERTAARLASATRTDVHFIEPSLTSTSQRLAGEFRDEPTIGFATQFYVYDYNDDKPLLRQFSWRENPSRSMEAPASSAGRAFYPWPSKDPIFVSIFEYAAGANLGLFSNDPNLGYAGLPVLRVGSPSVLRRPAFSGWGYAWVQASAPITSDHQLAVKFRSSTTPNDIPKTLQVIDVKSKVNDFYPPLRSDSLRPQLIWTGKDHAVGWMNDAGLNFVRFSENGDEICRTAPIAGLSWAWMNSLVHQDTAVYASVVTGQREPALIRLDANCAVSEPMRLSPTNAKVALGPNLHEGKPFLEVGHPVISSLTVNGKNQPGVAWVEEKGTNGLYGVMFRYFADELCN